MRPSGPGPKLQTTGLFRLDLMEGFESLRESPVALRDAAAVVVIQVGRSGTATAVIARHFPDSQQRNAAVALSPGFDRRCVAQQEGFVAFVVGADQHGDAQRRVQPADRFDLADRIVPACGDHGAVIARRNGRAEIHRHDVNDRHGHSFGNRILKQAGPAGIQTSLVDRYGVRNLQAGVGFLQGCDTLIADGDRVSRVAKRIAFDVEVQCYWFGGTGAVFVQDGLVCRLHLRWQLSTRLPRPGRKSGRRHPRKYCQHCIRRTK